MMQVVVFGCLQDKLVFYLVRKEYHLSCMPHFSAASICGPVQIFPPGSGQEEVPAFIEVLDLFVGASKRPHSIWHIHLKDLNAGRITCLARDFVSSIAQHTWFSL